MGEHSSCPRAQTIEYVWVGEGGRHKRNSHRYPGPFDKRKPAEMNTMWSRLWLGSGDAVSSSRAYSRPTPVKLSYFSRQFKRGQGEGKKRHHRVADAHIRVQMDQDCLSSDNVPVHAVYLQWSPECLSLCRLQNIRM